jgi:Skp family chaperone for outer membrane proteins
MTSRLADEFRHRPPHLRVTKAKKSTIPPAMNRCLVAGISLFSVVSSMAQEKVATVRLADVFQQCPEVAECKARFEQKKAALAQDVRAKAVEEKKAEIVGMNDEAKRLIQAYQKLAVKDEKAPESQNLSDYRKRRNLAESQLEALTLEYEEFQKEQEREMNQEMAQAYRVVLDRLTQLVAAHAREQGYDVVYDISGKSHVGLPVLLYAKPGLTTDVTDAIKAQLTQPEPSPAVPENAPSEQSPSE